MDLAAGHRGKRSLEGGRGLKLWWGEILGLKRLRDPSLCGERI